MTIKKTTPGSHAMALGVITLLCGLIYVTVQQAYRSPADDMPRQIARDMKNAIEHQRPLSAWMTRDTIELSKSLSVFKTLLNKNGQPIASTGLLDGELPHLPNGVLDFARHYQEDVFTWQPRRGVRMATVVEAVASPQIAFVVTGQSLQEVEQRESDLTTMVFIAWLVCTGIIFLHFVLYGFQNQYQTK